MKTVKSIEVDCSAIEHSRRKKTKITSVHFEKVSRLFRALGDESRLRLLEFISRGEACVTEIAMETKEGLSTISQRLRLLRADGLVKRRRDGKHLYYSLVDEHVLNLLSNAIEHIQEDSFRRK
ncbi:MAG: metalloregulator ArsR/SmtB family transcription factor [Leptospiraceae bacterium]|nr:metalloregulator ArsR/SmtB family transcription factor [Leptospiraceae bacterium]